MKENKNYGVNDEKDEKLKRKVIKKEGMNERGGGRKGGMYGSKIGGGRGK